MLKGVASNRSLNQAVPLMCFFSFSLCVFILLQSLPLVHLLCLLNSRPVRSNFTVRTKPAGGGRGRYIMALWP